MAAGVSCSAMPGQVKGWAEVCAGGWQCPCTLQHPQPLEWALPGAAAGGSKGCAGGTPHPGWALGLGQE